VEHSAHRQFLFFVFLDTLWFGLLIMIYCKLNNKVYSKNSERIVVTYESLKFIIALLWFWFRKRNFQPP